MHMYLIYQVVINKAPTEYSRVAIRAILADGCANSQLAVFKAEF